VTAKADYQGIVEDVVPANFVIDHISDNGQSEKDGDFTKIIWQVNLKAGTPKTFNYFIEFPKISPEFYLLGPITIGSFKEARQWQIASDAINSSTGVFLMKTIRLRIRGIEHGVVLLLVHKEYVYRCRNANK